MDISSKILFLLANIIGYLVKKGAKEGKIYVFMPFTVGLTGIVLVFGFWASAIGANFFGKSFELQEPFRPELVFIQGNTLAPTSNPCICVPQAVRRIKVVITAYSSTSWQTDDSPYITAAGSLVRDGIIANNLLPFGTRVRIPEIFGDKVFVVEDRMNKRKGHYQIDVWFPSYWEALNFGVKRTYIEVLEG